MVVEYVRALMQKRLVCRSGEERRQLAQQMVQDDQQFRELFHSLVRRTRLLLSCLRSTVQNMEKYLVQNIHPILASAGGCRELKHCVMLFAHKSEKAFLCFVG